MGFEPTHSVWKTDMLTIKHHIRKFFNCFKSADKDLRLAWQHHDISTLGL